MELTARALYAWGPILALVLLWIYFMGRIGSSRKRELGELSERLARMEALLDQIAAALERRTP